MQCSAIYQRSRAWSQPQRMPIWAVLTTPATFQEALLRKAQALSDPIRYQLTIQLAGRGKVFEPTCVYVGGPGGQPVPAGADTQQLIQAASYVIVQHARPATSLSIFVATAHPQLWQEASKLHGVSFPIMESPEELRARLLALQTPESEAETLLFATAVDDLLCTCPHLCHSSLRLAWVPSVHVPAVQRACERHGLGLSTEELGFRFHSRGRVGVDDGAARQNAAKVRELPGLGLFLDQLTAQDAPLVNSTWAYAGADTLAFCEEVIQVQITKLNCLVGGPRNSMRLQLTYLNFL